MTLHLYDGHVCVGQVGHEGDLPMYIEVSFKRAIQYFVRRVGTSYERIVPDKLVDLTYVQDLPPQRV